MSINLKYQFCSFSWGLRIYLKVFLFIWMVLFKIRFRNWNENKTGVYLHNSIELNFLNEITWTKAGPAAPKKAMFLLAWPDSSAPPKKVKFLLVLGSSASSISLRWPEIVLFSSGPDSWNCLRPATSVTLVLLLASFLSRASRSNFFLVNLIIRETHFLISSR